MTFIDQNLPAPQVDGVVDGNLDPDSLPDTGTTAHIRNVPTSWGGALLTLYLQDSQGSILYEARWPVGPHGRDIKLPLSRTLLSEHRGKEVRLRYEVSGIGASLPLDFKLEEAFSGSVEFDLAAYAYMVLYIHNIARPPADIPQFATLQRVQPGATAYSSDNEAVATVDAQGTVTVQGNGLVTITASGAPSGPGSYRLTITGIDEFHILGSKAMEWSGAQALCVEAGCVLPTSTDFARLKNFYRLPIGYGLPDLPAWGAPLGAETALTLNLISGQLGGTDVSDLLQGAGVRQPARAPASIATSVRSGALETRF